MIDLRVTTLGEKECAATFARAEPALRAELAAELDAIGREGVAAARQNVPKKSHRTEQHILYYTGRLASRSFREYNDRNDSTMRLLILPGEPTAHLIERGVNATISRRRDKSRDVYGVRIRKQLKTRTHIKFDRTAQGIRFVKPYQLRIPARPYFTPAMESLGDTGARLQAAVARAAAKAQGGA